MVKWQPTVQCKNPFTYFFLCLAHANVCCVQYGKALVEVLDGALPYQFQVWAVSSDTSNSCNQYSQVLAAGGFSRPAQFSEAQ